MKLTLTGKAAERYVATHPKEKKRLRYLPIPANPTKTMLRRRKRRSGFMPGEEPTAPQPAKKAARKPSKWSGGEG